MPTTAQTLLEQLTAEWNPVGPTALCLVQDMAAAREQVGRIRAARSSDPLDPKLLRLEDAALRAFHRATAVLMKMQTAKRAPAPAAPLPVKAAPALPKPAPVLPSPPMPPHIEREFAAHRRRDPLFDPVMDRSQMSKALRAWFDKHPAPFRPIGTQFAAPTP